MDKRYFCYHNANENYVLHALGFFMYKNGQGTLGTPHIVCKMHKPEDTTSIEDDSMSNTILLAST
jgi:hypothetical protein